MIVMGRKRKAKTSLSEPGKKKPKQTVPRFGWAKFPGLPYWPVKVIKKETVPQGDVYQVYVDSDNALLKVKYRDFSAFCESDFNTKKDEGIAALKRRKKYHDLEAFINDTSWMLEELKYDRASLLVCSRENTLKGIDLRMNQVIYTLCAENFKVAFDYSRAVFSPDGSYAMAGSSDGTLFVWNIQKGKIERMLKEHTHAVVACSWHPSGSVILSSEKQKKVILWSDI